MKKTIPTGIFLQKMKKKVVFQIQKICLEVPGDCKKKKKKIDDATEQLREPSRGGAKNSVAKVCAKTAAETGPCAISAMNNICFESSDIRSLVCPWSTSGPIEGQTNKNKKYPKTRNRELQGYMITPHSHGPVS